MFAVVEMMKRERRRRAVTGFGSMVDWRMIEEEEEGD